MVNKEQKKHRRKVEENLATQFCSAGLHPVTRMSKRLKFMLKSEQPIVLKGERITFLRTVKNLPPIFTDDEMQEQFTKTERVGNICPDYATTIKHGLLHQRNRCEQKLKDSTEEQKLFLLSVLESIDAVIDLSKRYRDEAIAVGNHAVAEILTHIPENGARNLHEALQFFRILHFSLWSEGNIHNGLGRFDQYMHNYWKNDIDSGILSETEAYSLLLEFFITFNRDNDLYQGIQKGDNGQSLMLGGCDKDRNCVFNSLSKACLKASGELMMIDPKINLRVDKNTPLDIFILGTELTKKGLGFPQYSNDDIVIEGLLKLGYSSEDAYNYTVAACWEFIIPGKGMDIPNIDALSYPKSVNNCTKNLNKYKNFDDFLQDVKKDVVVQGEELVQKTKDWTLFPAPFMSVLMDDCIEKAEDVSCCAKYKNFGLHAVGLSTAVDSLYAIKKYIFDDKTIGTQRMIDAIDSDFEQDSELLSLLRYNTAKFGDNDDFSNSLACELTKTFSGSLKNKRNVLGGIYRPGTGSAMHYMWMSDNMPATAGGHRRHEPLETNYAPSLHARNKGPFSVIQSFTKPNLVEVINGGPLTMEFHKGIFGDNDSIKKVAYLVSEFIRLGGHQLQLNSIDRKTLLDAQKHPEKHQNLIVRVWGWSAYFVDLDKKYQNHVISRQEYTL